MTLVVLLRVVLGISLLLGASQSHYAIAASADFGATYDANGNQTKRISGSTTYWLVVTRSGLESVACDNQPPPRPMT